VALGALRLTSTPVTEAGWRWHILADPDGNEFCILQPPAAYWPPTLGQVNSASSHPSSRLDAEVHTEGADE